MRTYLDFVAEVQLGPNNGKLEELFMLEYVPGVYTYSSRAAAAAAAVSGHSRISTMVPYDAFMFLLQVVSVKQL